MRFRDSCDSALSFFQQQKAVDDEEVIKGVHRRVYRGIVDDRREVLIA